MFEHIVAGKYIVGNQKLLSKSRRCGCIGCLEIYDPKEINQWHGDDIEGVEPNAICAYCNSDRVLPEAAGYPLTREFLTKMHNYWIEPVREYTVNDVIREEGIDEINRRYLAEKGFRIEEEDLDGTYDIYRVYESENLVFSTITPKELLIKLAQLLPSSEVSVAREEFSVGDEDMSFETLKILIHQE